MLIADDSAGGNFGFVPLFPSTSLREREREREREGEGGRGRDLDL